MTTTDLDRALHTQVLKREAIKEKAYRDDRAKLEEQFHNEFGLGGTQMTQKELRKIIDSDRRMYYRTEELNDKLYIHYKGWRELENLEGWTGLKTIYAECNAFSTITGLQNCTKLRSLFLQENCIKQISGLETLTELWSLNLSSNFIERIEGLSKCTKLNTLTIAKNKIGFGGIEDIEQLAHSSICSLDIQDNRLEDPDILPEVFARMADLRVLYLKGNPAAKKIVNYRKSLTVYCKELRYIDDRPVFEDDRRTAEAFNRGGLEEERAERKRIKEEKSQAHDRNMRLFSEMIANSRKEKKEREAMRNEDKYTDDTDPVESYERRQKRLLDKWKDENAEDLKDHAREHAARCLKAEREAKERGEEQKENIDQNATDVTQKAAADSRSKDVESADAENVDDEPLIEEVWDDEPSGETSKAHVVEDPQRARKEDNRKLVYEDIWDDVPQSKAAPPPNIPASASSARHPPRATDDVFLPWAEGAVGMDAISPSESVMEQRKAAFRTKAADTAAETGVNDAARDGTSEKKSWHSRYMEKAAQVQAKLQASPAPQFAPPPRTVQSSPSVASPSSEAGAAGGGEPTVGLGELDEMD